jgi:hypothetical protein
MALDTRYCFGSLSRVEVNNYLTPTLDKEPIFIGKL